MSKFQIYTLPIAKGELGLSPLPVITGADSKDLTTISEWGADILITMMPLQELKNLNSLELPRMIEAASIDWRHMPVQDYGTPQQQDAELWTNISSDVQKHLAQGAKVLFHCRGGCGRSGMAVLRIMIEMGENPHKALLRLREARPCAVETQHQLAWAIKGPLQCS